MAKIAVFPGSFDPITIGHYDIIQRALPLFDKLIIGIGLNSEKNSFFPIAEREAWIKDLFKEEKKIEVQEYKGLTTEFCKKIEAGFIIRGLRTSADFEFEKSIAQMNRSMTDIETVFIISDPAFTAVSSSIIREILRYKGNVDKFLPPGVIINQGS